MTPKFILLKGNPFEGMVFTISLVARKIILILSATYLQYYFSHKKNPAPRKLMRREA